MNGVIAYLSSMMDQLLARQMIWKGLLAFFCLLSIYWMCHSIVSLKRKQWEMNGFLLLSSAILVWAGFLLASTVAWGEAAGRLRALSQLGQVFMPLFLSFSTWRQVHYKELSRLLYATFIAPVVLSCFIFWEAFQGISLTAPLFLYRGWGMWTYLVYMVLMLGTCYQLCLNTLYQTPAHIRKVAGMLMVGITIIALGVVTDFGIDVFPDYNLSLVASVLGMCLIYEEFRAISSSNIIATSRDFVFHSLSTIILVLSRQRRILDWNQKNAEGIFPEPLYKESFEHYRQRLLSEANGAASLHNDNVITVTHRETGEETHFLITMNPIRGEKRQFGHLVEISNVTEIYDVMRLVQEVASVDQLTGLFNRNAYQNTVRGLVEGDNLPMVVVVGDVNNLKRLNDNAGHLAGDRLLVDVSKAIRAALPEGAMAYRIGGDEFVMLMPQAKMEMADQFIEQTNKHCGEYADPVFGTPSVSWGYACMTSPEEDYNAVFAQADKMMYEVKRSHHQHFISSGIVPGWMEVKAEMRERELAFEERLLPEEELPPAEEQATRPPEETLPPVEQDAPADAGEDAKSDTEA